MDNSYPYCFACGDKAPVGLHLKFRYEGDEAVCDCEVDRVFQGYNGVVHGGILATLLDEAMAYAVLRTEKLAVTGKLEISYRKPVMVNTPLVLRARVDLAKKRIYKCSASISSPDGETLVEGTSTYVRVKST